MRCRPQGIEGISTVDRTTAAEFLYQRERRRRRTARGCADPGRLPVVTAEHRQQYHQRIAQVLEERFPETAETQPEWLAHHYTQAGLTEQVVPRGRRRTRQSPLGLSGSHQPPHHRHRDAKSRQRPRSTRHALTMHTPRRDLQTKGFSSEVDTPTPKRGVVSAGGRDASAGSVHGLWRSYSNRPQRTRRESSGRPRDSLTNRPTTLHSLSSPTMPLG